MVLCAAARYAVAQSGQIHVGPNVQVSKAQEKRPMREVQVSADPTDPNHLLGCGIADDGAANKEWTVVYLSNDAGKTWQPTLETTDFSGDPACALGRDGLASYVAITIAKDEKEQKEKGHRVALIVYRSGDGGKTWQQQEDLPMDFQGIDNEAIAIDPNDGKHKNWVYISGTSHRRDLAGKNGNSFAVWVSRDEGRTFTGPLNRADAPNHYVLDVGNGVVFADGTFLTGFGDLKNSNGAIVADSNIDDPNSELVTVRVTDEGQTLSPSTKVDDFYMINEWHKGGVSASQSLPRFAADTGGGPFKDRLYAVWTDDRDGRAAMRFAYSVDKGVTWSRSVVIDDVTGPVNRQITKPENLQTTIAVNKAGVVLAAWYDRRDNPDGLGWYIRARASLDGGETWLPSVRVSSEPNVFTPRTKLFLWANAAKPAPAAVADAKETGSKGPLNPTRVSASLNQRQFVAGDYSGLDADAAGIFHSFWIDDRTGIPQIWTAPITVVGKVVRNGDPALADLKDVSADVELKIVSTDYDRATNTVTIEAQLNNTSDKTIKGPIKLRLVHISSGTGTALAANSDNHLSEAGALWDCTSLLQGSTLKPREMSATKRLTFHVNNPQPFYDGKLVYTASDVIDFDVRILAGSVELAAPVEK
jgi:hypothetical protein